jgi:hypothetical protein
MEARTYAMHGLTSTHVHALFHNKNNNNNDNNTCHALLS